MTEVTPRAFFCDMAKKLSKADEKLHNADLKHFRETEKYVKMVEALYQKAIYELSALAVKVDGIPMDKSFSFAANPAIAKEVDEVIGKLAGRITSAIESGARKEWDAACAKSSEYVESILKTSKLTKTTLQRYQDRNLAALAAFQERKVEGLNLSERVWKHVAPLKDEVEMVTDTTKKYYKHGINSSKSLTKIERALGTGMSAADLSREVRSCLKEPNKLFRRVKDKYGNLHLSKAAKAYHPGQGVYRSSYKNAMRLTRSEINMAYRQSDHMRWQQLDFVVGMEVHTSNNHPESDLCDCLKGKYPKDFKFVGWHPQCRCFVTPILKDYEQWNKDRENIGNPEYKEQPSAEEVRDVPKGFKDYVKDNEERMKGWKSTPYYLKDNPQYVDMALHPEKYVKAALVLSDDVQKRLSDFEIYGFNHQGSSKFNNALNAAKEAVLKGEQKAFDDAMAEMERVMSKNEASTASKAAKKKLKQYTEEDARKKMISDDLSTFSDEQKKNIKELEAALKQKKGLRMSYEEANTGKENPHYADFINAKKYVKDENGHYVFKNGKAVVNPEYTKLKGYAVNCQTCTLIHELRRRGFNVEAISNYRGKVWDVYKKQGVGSRQQGYSIGKWLDKDGKPVGPTYAHEWAKKKGIYISSTTSKYVDYTSQVKTFFEEYSGGKDGRFEIYVDWKGGSAHVFCAERVNGQWKFFDPQSAKMDVFDGYAAQAKLHTFGIIRTDDKLINPKLASTFIPKGELPIVVKQKTRADEIREIAQKRHDARTPEKVKELRDFAAKHKQMTDDAYKELNDILADAKGIKEADVKALSDMLSGKDGVKMKSSDKVAKFSIEKMRKEAEKMKPIIKEYNDAMDEVEAIIKDLSGIKDIDMNAVKKAIGNKSIKQIKAETKKLEQKKRDIIDSMSELIPNVDDLRKTYSLSELSEAHKELESVLNKWLSKYSYSSIDNAPLDHLKNKLDFELSSSTFNYTNKTIIEKAIKEKIAIINQKIEWNNLVLKSTSLKSFNSKAASYKKLLAKVEAAIKSKDIEALKKSIAAAEAEQMKILEKMAKRGGDIKTALNSQYKGGALGTDISSSIDVSNMVSKDPYRGTFTNNIARIQGFDAPAKLVTETEFESLEKACGEVFYRTVNPTRFKGKDMTSEEFASQLYVADKLELNGPGGRVYGDGMYVATSAWNGRKLETLTDAKKQTAYRSSYAYGHSNPTIYEMTFTRKPKIIKQTELEDMWRKLDSATRARFGDEANTYACALGYDAMYCDGPNYMVIWNRSIIAVKKV